MRELRKGSIPWLEHHLKDLIESGQLQPGDELPTIKEMSDEYGMPNTSVGAARARISRLGLTYARSFPVGNGRGKVTIVAPREDGHA